MDTFAGRPPNICEVLSGPNGLKILLDALPHDLAPPGGEKQAQVAVQKLLVSLCNQALQRVGPGKGGSHPKDLSKGARKLHRHTSSKLLMASSAGTPNLFKACSRDRFRSEL